MTQLFRSQKAFGNNGQFVEVVYPVGVGVS
ncbi:hypothetical protein Pan258_28550 [Symmachiella dynata]|nr:hypothetical protein Pan258_28550 [Symmachiella dynata]